MCFTPTIIISISVSYEDTKKANLNNQNGFS